MEGIDWISVINTVLLVSIFYYQHGKNKVLVERIDAQRVLIDETKTVVISQSSAIESQGRVVDSALKYSEAFSIEKLEEIIRREISIEVQEEKRRLSRAFKRLLKIKISI